MNTKRRIGIDFKDEGTGSELSARDVLDLARQAEAAGFESIWLNEDIGRDSIAMLAAISTTTNSIGVGTAIVNVYTRSAFQIAMAAATLDELSQGRAPGIERRPSSMERSSARHSSGSAVGPAAGICPIHPESAQRQTIHP